LSIGLDSFVASRYFTVWAEETARTAMTTAQHCVETAADARLTVAEAHAR